MIYLIILAILIGISLVSLFVCSVVAHCSYFMRRYEGNPNLKYFTEKDFDGLQADPIQFPSDKGQILRGYIYSSREVTKPLGLIVFVHGFGAGHQAYTTEINTLAKSGYTVVAYDGTGCVNSGGKHFYGFDQAPLDLHYALRYLERDPRFQAFDRCVVVGHSWGGFTAMNSVLEDKVAGVVSMCGFISGAGVMAQRAFGQNKKGAARAGWQILLPFLRLLNFLTLGRYANRDSVRTLKNTEKPVLLLYGERDKTVYYPDNGARLSKELENRENIRFYRYENKGHSVYLTTEAENEMNKTFSEIKKVAKMNAQQAKKMYSEIDYPKITEEDGEVMNRIIEFCGEILDPKN